MPEAQHMAHEDHHRALVGRLAAGIKPTRRLWPISIRMGLWTALGMGILAWFITHTDNTFMVRFIQPVYASEICLFAGAAVIFAIMALRSAIPGRILGVFEAMLASVFVAAGVLLVIVGEPMRTSESLAEFLRIGLPCALSIFVIAMPSWLILLWLVKRGAPMRARLSGLLVGAGALSLSFATMRIACPIDEPLHLLTWHLLPAIMLTVLSAIAGTIWLQFRPRLRISDHANGSGRL